MGKFHVAYYVVKNGRGYWQPTKAMRDRGFQATACGIDGPAAWAKAEQLNREWQLFRHGLQPSDRSKWPKGSFGDGFERFKKSHEWHKLKPRTREDWERGQRLIEPVFGDVAPHSVTFEHIDSYYHRLLDERGVDQAYRAIKHWRRLWQKCAAFALCDRNGDPSSGIRRQTPKPRSQVWKEGEVVRLVKHALREGYHGLACIIAVAWDTQFSPVDVRKLVPDNLLDHNGQLYFGNLKREKSQTAIIGTLSARTQRLVAQYLNQDRGPVDHRASLFSHRSGNPYSKDKLAKDFRDVRNTLFPGDNRVLMDMRRSGAVEASAGAVDPNALAAKMGNTINRSQALQRTYQPPELSAVRAADAARRAGRRRIRDEG